MKAIEEFALTKVKVSKGVRNEISPGKHEVDFLVRVSGTLTVGEDYETKPTVSLPVKEILALFAARAGFTRERTIELLREVTTEALESGKAGASGEVKEAISGVSEYLEMIQKELIEKLPKAKRAGRVTAKVTAEMVG